MPGSSMPATAFATSGPQAQGRVAVRQSASFGWDAHGVLAWFYAGGGEALYGELVNGILKLNVTG